MKSLAKLGAGLRGLAVLTALVLGLSGQVATATESGGGGGNEGGNEGGNGGSNDGEETRDPGGYYESGEADRPPPGFVVLTRAISAFHNNSLFLSPEEATARFLWDLTYGPLIELLTALSFQQQFGPPREAQAAPQEAKKAASKPSGFVQLGEGLSVMERIQISEKLAGVLGRKDALYTEEDGGLPYWVFEEDCGENSGTAGAGEPAPPRIIWEVEAAAGDASKGVGEAKPSGGKDPAGECKEKSIRDMERRALDFFDEEYLWLQIEFGAKDKESVDRKVKMVEEKIEEIKKKRQKKGQ